MVGQMLIALAVASSLVATAFAQGFPYVVCAEAYTTYSAGHFLANINNKGSESLGWETTKDLFIVTVRQNSIHFEGDLKPKTGSNKNKIMHVDLTFRDKHDIDECFCSSQKFLDAINGKTFNNPNYFKIEKLCSKDLLMDPAVNPKGLLNCPRCEGGECGKARRSKDSPSPIYKDWKFYGDTVGGFSGEGLEVFRKQISKFFPVDPSVTECSPVLTNLPLAQFGCSDLQDPSKGFGYGVNGKNQKCGFAAWFTCAEDHDALSRDGESFIGHYADFNFNIVPCPPTVAPTPYPTGSPTTGSPTTSPTSYCEWLHMQYKDCYVPTPFPTN